MEIAFGHGYGIRLTFCLFLTILGTNFYAPYFTHPKKMMPLVARPAGTSAMLQCIAAGNPEPETSWFKDGKLVKKDSNVARLKLKKLKHHDSGNYTCQVHNSYGLIQFHFTLEVVERNLQKPEMPEKIQKKTVQAGEEAGIECCFISDLQPSVRWLIISHTDMDSNVHIIHSTKQNFTYVSSLIIKKVTFEDAGHYICEASNALGSSHTDVWLTVLLEPKPNIIMIVIIFYFFFIVMLCVCKTNC